MIILQTGVPGSGKTSSVVNMLMTDESYTHFTDKDGVKKKRPLFVNGIPELKIEHEELSDEQIKSQQTFFIISFLIFTNKFFFNYFIKCVKIIRYTIFKDFI